MDWCTLKNLIYWIWVDLRKLEVFAKVVCSTNKHWDKTHKLCDATNKPWDATNKARDTSLFGGRCQLQHYVCVRQWNRFTCHTKHVLERAATLPVNIFQCVNSYHHLIDILQISFGLSEGRIRSSWHCIQTKSRWCELKPYIFRVRTASQRIFVTYFCVIWKLLAPP